MLAFLESSCFIEVFVNSSGFVSSTNEEALNGQAKELDFLPAKSQDYSPDMH